MRPTEIPEFGSLSDMTVLFVGLSVAVPFAAELLAEQGARVIQVEGVKMPDTARLGKRPFGFLCEHRNELCISLDLSNPDGAAMMLRLCKKADVVMEGLRPGTFAKWGLSDEELWKANPRLVITHVTGFGQAGDPEYLKRGSFDPIGQAFSGYLAISGEPGSDVPGIAPYACDYFTAFSAAYSTLAAVIAARRTGSGDSLDVTQYESMLKVQFSKPPDYFATGREPARDGEGSSDFLGVGVFPCGAGQVALCMGTPGSVKPLISFLGLCNHRILAGKDVPFLMRGDEAAEFIWENLQNFLLSHTADEVEDKFAGLGIPCSKVNSYRDLESNPHVEARGSFEEWEDPRFGHLKGVGIFPKMRHRQGITWSSAHDWGEDNDDVLTWAGLSGGEIRELYGSGVLRHPDAGGGYMVTRLPRRGE